MIDFLIGFTIALILIVFLNQLKKVRVYNIIKLFFNVIMYSLIIALMLTIIKVIGG